MDKGTLENLNHEWSPQDPSKTRRLKVILPQCYAALAIFALNLSHVIFESACYVVELPAHFESTLNMAFGVGITIGFLFGGIVAQITGPRVIVILAGAVSVAGWIILEWIPSETILKWTIYIVALAGGMIRAPSFVYLAEISQPNMRNALVSTIFVSLNIALVYFTLAGRETVTIAAFINIIFALFGLVVMLFSPNSPYWLANKGRHHAAESSLAWFRGRTTVENVKYESKTIINNAQNHPTMCEIFRQAPLYISISIVSYVFVASIFLRIFAVQFFSHASIMLWRLGYDELAIRMSSYFGISTVLLSIGFVVLIGILGKRTVFLISLFGGTITILIASIAGYLNESNILSTNTYSWVFIICSTAAYLCLIISVDPVTLLLNVELFPSRLRYFGVGFGLFLMKIISTNNVHLDVLIKFPLALLIFASCSMIALISLLWIFPRNENKSLVEIEHSSKELFTSMKKRVTFCISYIAKLITCKHRV